MAAAILEHALLLEVAAAAVIVGSMCLYTLFGRKPSLVLPPQRCRAVPWSAGICLLCFVLVSLPQQLFAGIFLPDQPVRAERVMAMLMASLWCFPFQIVAFKAVVRFVSGTFLPFGVDSWKAVGRDARIGCAAWLVATPVVLGIQILVRSLALNFTVGPPTENALIETVKLYQDNTAMWGLVGYEAIFMAPVREEFFFRGCLQSWLTRRPWGGDLAVGLALIAPAVLFGPSVSLATTLKSAAFVVAAAIAMWASGPRLQTWSARWPWLFPPLGRGGVSGQAAFRGVVGTSLFFAVCHASSWPDPVPLFALSLVLGWLSWRTQGVVAPMVCHAMFNATSLLILRLTPNLGG